MPNPRLASRYAKSILDLSIEQDQLDAVLKDMQYLNAVVSESRDFQLLLQSPIIKADKKKSIIDEVLSSKVSDLTMKFIHLMISKGRESNLTEIATAFQNQYNDLKMIKEVSVTTAVPMNEEVSAIVSRKAAELAPGKTVAIKEIVNPDIIGGFIIEIDDKLYDASVRKELNEIRKQFSQNAYIPAI